MHQDRMRTPMPCRGRFWHLTRYPTLRRMRNAPFRPTEAIQRPEMHPRRRTRHYLAGLLKAKSFKCHRLCHSNLSFLRVTLPGDLLIGILLKSASLKARPSPSDRAMLTQGAALKNKIPAHGCRPVLTLASPGCAKQRETGNSPKSWSTLPGPWISTQRPTQVLPQRQRGSSRPRQWPGSTLMVSAQSLRHRLSEIFS